MDWPLRKRSKLRGINPKRLKRKSYFVDERALSRAKKALGAKTEAEVIRLSVERVAEMEEFWEFMKKTRRKLKPGSVEKS